MDADEIVQNVLKQKHTLNFGSIGYQQTKNRVASCGIDVTERATATMLNL